MLFIALLVQLTGCAVESEEESEAVVGDAAAGADVYSANCMSCHGADGKGDDANGFPNLVETAMSADEIEAQVRAGAGAMPAFEGTLDDQEIADVVAYVQELAPVAAYVESL